MLSSYQRGYLRPHDGGNCKDWTPGRLVGLEQDMLAFGMVIGYVGDIDVLILWSKPPRWWRAGSSLP